ncbi:MAG TPA: LysE family transporter [Ottowia sp.]|uniref:LysE family transporter n=1 Tax=Ottowia sp. TaxID=1898956 RepID=UPI002C89F952|nr:LysE family transporter [Ottowia sp.]HMN22485.1 LysE family transporter [Ottowia sp.]
MLGITDYAAFVVAFWLFLMVPGPGNLVIAAGTTQGGVRGGMIATLGVIAGDQVLIWCALGGVAALLHAYPMAFSALQWAGAIYLAWLGIRMWRARPHQGAALAAPTRQHFRQAFLITLLNPKSIVFYVAFLPLFIDPARQQGVVTFAALAATAAVLVLLYGFIESLLVHRFAERMRASARMSGLLRKLASVFLIGFGVRLATSS